MRFTPLTYQAAILRAAERYRVLFSPIVPAPWSDHDAWRASVTHKAVRQLVVRAAREGVDLTPRGHVDWATPNLWRPDRPKPSHDEAWVRLECRRYGAAPRRRFVTNWEEA